LIAMTLRWEWRTFGDRFGAAEGRLGSMDVERVAESDETYLLSAEGRDAVKIRAGLMDVKHLEQVDGDGLELWKPVMKSPLPISAADARVVLAAWGGECHWSEARTTSTASPPRAGRCSSPYTRNGGTSRSAGVWRS
jgi:hypothetical protein